jgi:hypothetical protein
MFEAIPVLSSVECDRVRQTVHALRSSWIVRGSVDYAFYTVGAASYNAASSGTRRQLIGQQAPAVDCLWYELPCTEDDVVSSRANKFIRSSHDRIQSRF